MNNKKKCIACLLGGALAIGYFLPVYAARADDEQKPPLGCRDVGYSFHLKVLQFLSANAGERNSLYFIRNKKNEVVHLYQMRGEDSARSTYLNHSIRPNQWAVLSTCEKQLNYICTVNDKKSAYGRVVDCADALQVCEYARVKFGLNNRGNHWIVEGNTRNGAVREVVRYGIIPR